MRKILAVLLFFASATMVFAELTFEAKEQMLIKRGYTKGSYTKAKILFYDVQVKTFGEDWGEGWGHLVNNLIFSFNDGDDFIYTLHYLKQPNGENTKQPNLTALVYIYGSEGQFAAYIKGNYNLEGVPVSETPFDLDGVLPSGSLLFF